MTRKEINDYAHTLSNSLFRDVKICGHSIDMDPMCGSIWIVPNDTWWMYCSPLWDGDKEGISIVWYHLDDNPKKENMLTLPFVPTFDLETDKANYVAIVTEYFKNNASRFTN